MAEEKKQVGYSRIALLIDGDNCNPDNAHRIIKVVSGFGTITIRKVFANWSYKQGIKWKDVSLIYHIIPVQEFNHKPGKNASDIALIIDAMKMCFANEADCFCIASSDSDYTSLIMHLQSQNKKVIVIGKTEASMALVKVSDVFIDESTLGEEEKLTVRFNKDSEKEESVKQTKKRSRIISRKQTIKIVGKINLLPAKKTKDKVLVMEDKVFDSIFDKAVDAKTGIAPKKRFLNECRNFRASFNIQQHGFNSFEEFIKSFSPRYETVFSPNNGTGIKKVS